MTDKNPITKLRLESDENGKLYVRAYHSKSHHWSPGIPATGYDQVWWQMITDLRKEINQLKQVVREP